MKACFTGSMVKVSSERLTFPERQTLSTTRADSFLLQAGSIGSQAGVQFALSSVLVDELLQNLFSGGSSSSGCCPDHFVLQACAQNRGVLGRGRPCQRWARSGETVVHIEGREQACLRPVLGVRPM